LFETETIADADEDCPHGGLRVTSGHDDGQPDGTPGDGQLQDGEIELDRAVCLAPTDVLVSGGNGDCSVTPGKRGSTGLLWSVLLGALGMIVRRRRRMELGRNR
jgi:MYXO-CTERM domain-containing protein